MEIHLPAAHQSAVWAEFFELKLGTLSDMALDSMQGSLRQRGVRLTRQRQILLDLIDKSGEHLDAERLFQLAKENDPKLNRVTVYRTLKMLKTGGLVDELDLMHHEGDQHYYETRLKQEHAHVICLRCGKVEEFFGEPLQRLRRQIEATSDFRFCWRAPKWADIARIARRCGRAKWRVARGETAAPAGRRAQGPRPPLTAMEPSPSASPAAPAAALPVPGPASLTVTDPNGHRTRVSLDPLPFHIGRHAENQLILRDSRVSRSHARIEVELGEYVLHDCGSRHGTFVNGAARRAARAAARRPHRVRRARFLPGGFLARRPGAEAPGGAGGRAGKKRGLAASAWVAIWASCAPCSIWRAPCKARSR